MHDGEPFLRSTLRPPVDGTVRTGFEPCDLDGDNSVRWMRWRDPAGPFVSDPDVPLFMRPRRVDDDPSDAWFMSTEGNFLNWDGVKWKAAPLKYGLDLNRNFPASWAPFSMFGMDSGLFPTSEPESRAVIEAFAERKHIAAALTNHTYTGALLCSPYRESDPIPQSDVRLMQLLAEDLVRDTDYRVFKVYPDFVYDPKMNIVGVWDDALSSVFGVLGYTLELWDPFRHAGIENPKPAEFFSKPDPTKIKQLIEKFSEDDGAAIPWTPFEHPQLGPVEIGGLDYLRTIRNPPVALLAEECQRGFLVADRLRKALPTVKDTVTVTPMGQGVHKVQLVLENSGFLSTASLTHAETIGAALPVSAAIEPAAGVRCLDNERLELALEHLDGWGNLRCGNAINSIYATLSARGHRADASWTVQGSGSVTLRWQAGRGGRGETTVEIGEGLLE